MKTPTVLELKGFLTDARRFLLYHRQIVELYPMQIYLSALIFTPANSIVRQTFQKNELPNWILETPSLPDEWDATIQEIIYPKLLQQGFERPYSIRVDSVAQSGNTFALICSTANYAHAEDFISETKDVAVINSDGKLLYTCRHTGTVRRIAFSPEGKLVSSTENTVQIWDTQGRPETCYTFEWESIVHEEEDPRSPGEATHVNEHHTNSFIAQDMIVNNEGEIILSRSEGNILRIYSFLDAEKKSTSYDLSSLGQSKYPLEHSQTLDGRIMLWRPNHGYRIFHDSSEFSAGDGDIHILNLSNKSTIALRKHTSFIASVSSNLHAHVSSVSVDGQLILWGGEGVILQSFHCGGNIVKVLLLENDFIVTQQHHNRGVGSSQTDDIWLWGPDGKRKRHCTITGGYPAHNHNPLLALPLSKNEKLPHVGVPCTDRMVIMDTNLLNMEKEPKSPVEYCLPAFRAQTVTQFLQNGDIEVVDVRERSTREFSRVAGGTRFDPHVHNEVSPDGSLLCCVQREESHDVLHVFDSRSGKETRAFVSNLCPVGTLGNTWNASTFDCRMMASRSQIAFSADNRFLAWRKTSGIVRAEIESGNIVELEFETHIGTYDSHLALSPNGRYAVLATNYDNVMWVYDLQDGKLVQTMEGQLLFFYLDWSGGGDYLVMSRPPTGGKNFIIFDMRCLSSNYIDERIEQRSSSATSDQIMHCHALERGYIPPELEPFANEHRNTAFGSYLRQSLRSTSEHPKFYIDFDSPDWIRRNDEKIIFIPEKYGMRAIVRIGEDKAKVHMAGLTEGGEFIWFTFSTDESKFRQFAANSGWTA
jgi:WD40 repeat protein